jgi:hypothetical protein
MKSKLIFALCIFCISVNSQTMSTVVSRAGVELITPISLAVESVSSNKEINYFTLSGLADTSYSISTPIEVGVVSMGSTIVFPSPLQVSSVGIVGAELKLNKYGKGTIEAKLNLDARAFKTGEEYYGVYRMTINYN